MEQCYSEPYQLITLCHTQKILTTHHTLNRKHCANFMMSLLQNNVPACKHMVANWLYVYVFVENSLHHGTEYNANIHLNHNYLLSNSSMANANETPPTTERNSFYNVCIVYPKPFSSHTSTTEYPKLVI